MSIDRLIRDGRARLGWSEQQFADALGVTRGAVQQWEKPGGTVPSRAHLLRVASLLGMTATELMAGQSGAEPAEPATLQQRAMVPILEDNEAARFADLDNFGDHDGRPMVSVSVDVRRHTFALRVKGDAMLGADGDSFAEGSVIVVEPELAPRPGDYVVVLKEEKMPIFKMLVQKEDELLLKSLNPRYPVRPLGDGVVIGVVREFSKRFR